MSAPQIETRVVHIPLELREVEAGQVGNRLVGYAAMFGRESDPLNDGYGDFVELIAPGAFARSLRESPDVRALYNHDTNCVLGRTKSGTLRLWEDETGLRFEVDLPDTQAARDLKASIQRGDIDGCSFGFVCRRDEVALVGDKLVRTLIDVDLFEISTGVVFPAYGATTVSVRSRAAHPAVVRTTPRLDAARRRLRILDL